MYAEREAVTRRVEATRALVVEIHETMRPGSLRDGEGKGTDFSDLFYRGTSRIRNRTPLGPYRSL